MGRGGYLGGSTIVYPGSDWFSGVVKREPAGKKSKRRHISTNTCSPEALAFLKSVVKAEKEKLPIPECPSGMSSDLVTEIRRAGGCLEWAKTKKEYRFYKSSTTHKDKRDTPSKNTRQKTPKLSPEARRSDIRQSYITGILSAEQKGRPLPDRPRILRAELEPIGTHPDDVVRWAKQQPEARVFLDRALLKRAQSLPDQAVRVQFLTSVVGAMMRKHPMPGIPKKSAAVLEPLLAGTGDLAAWARSQPEYAALAHRVLSKIRKSPTPAPQASRTKATARPTTNLSSSKPAPLKRQFRQQDAEDLKRNILTELQRTHPVASVQATIDAEASAWTSLQRDAHSRLGVSSSVDIRKFPAYFAIYKDIKAALRARRQ